MKISALKITCFFLLISSMFGSCKKDEYYTDGGLAQAKFDGSILDYLDAKPREFDSIAAIIRLAGLEEEFRNQEFTFFAPRDEDIKELIGLARKNAYQNAYGVNQTLYILGRDTISQLSDVDGDIWRKYLLRYMFIGKRKLADYPQIDFNLLNVYKGQNYTSFGNTVCNIGVVYNNASGLQYLGYRQLYISYIPDISQPTQWFSIPIASSDIQPTNGVVHVLDYTRAYFGYTGNEVSEDIIESKRISK